MGSGRFVDWGPKELGNVVINWPASTGVAEELKSTFQSTNQTLYQRDQGPHWNF